MSSLGSKIRDLRIEKGMTQGELGNGLVTPSMISQIEADKANPSHKLLAALAERLDAPLDFFLTDMQTKLEQTSTYKTARQYMQQQNLQEAVALLEELRESSAPHLQRNEIAFDLANCYEQLGHHKEAFELFEEVLSTAIREDHQSLRVNCLNMQGKVQYRLHQLTLARHYWEKAEKLLGKSTDIDQALCAQVYINLGIVNSALEHYPEALNYYGRASELLQGTSEMEKIGDVYHGLGQAYKSIGNYKLAAEYTHDAITMLKSLNRLKQSYDVRLNLANIRVLEGKYDEALQLYHDCLEGFTLHGSQSDIANTHCEMARLFIAKGQLVDARMLCESALKMVESTSPIAGDTYHVLGKVFLEENKLDKAKSALTQAIHIFANRSLTSYLIKAQHTFADVCEREGSIQDAYGTMKEVCKVLESSLREFTH